MTIKQKKPRVYVESSTISYLTARPTEEPLRKAKQIFTRMWWERRGFYDLFISQAVVNEIGEGDPEAAEARLDVVRGIPLLSPIKEIQQLTDALLKSGVVPHKVEADALHIAYAAVHGMDFLITWNQKHIATDKKRKQIEAIIDEFGFRAPRLLTPERHLIFEET